MAPDVTLDGNPALRMPHERHDAHHAHSAHWCPSKKNEQKHTEVHATSSQQVKTEPAARARHDARAGAAA